MQSRWAVTVESEGTGLLWADPFAHLGSLREELACRPVALVEPTGQDQGGDTFSASLSYGGHGGHDGCTADPRVVDEENVLSILAAAGDEGVTVDESVRPSSGLGLEVNHWNALGDEVGAQLLERAGCAWDVVAAAGHDSNRVRRYADQAARAPDMSEAVRQERMHTTEGLRTRRVSLAVHVRARLLVGDGVTGEANQIGTGGLGDKVALVTVPVVLVHGRTAQGADATTQGIWDDCGQVVGWQPLTHATISRRSASAWARSAWRARTWARMLVVLSATSAWPL